MKTLRLEIDADGIATVTFDQPGASVNTMTAEWQSDLAAAVERLERERERIRGVLLASAKKTFFAGADLKAVLGAEDAAEAFAEIESLKRSYRRLETLGRPVVALLAGAALGGGWELALAAHARFALDDAAIRFGTPEVTLGLIPGATGITKTVRHLGLVAAQPYLVDGKLFGPRDALALGLVDGVADDVADLRRRALDWIGANPGALQPWDRKGYRIPGGGPAEPRLAAALAVAPALLAQRTRGLYPAPQAALEAMVEGARVDYDTATRIESRKLAKLMVGQTTKNMISAFFFDLKAVRAGPSRPQGCAPRRPAKIGVIGAGILGAAIADASASRGIACVLKDASIEAARSGLAAITQASTADVDDGRIDATDHASIVDNVIATGSVADLRGCELIIDASLGPDDAKAATMREAEPMLESGAVFASIIASLPIDTLAAASAAPERFVGLRFLSPPTPVRSGAWSIDSSADARLPAVESKLVEIVRGRATSDATVARAFDCMLALGTTPIVVDDARGLFTSRIFGAYMIEGATMLDEGVAPALIEHAALAAGMPLGPLAALDETSLAGALEIVERTRVDRAAEGDAFERGPGERLIARMVDELRRCGRAAGGGFYDDADGDKRLWPELKRLFGRSDATAEIGALKQRLLYRQSIETARCIAEGVVTSVAEADIATIFGFGFPAWTGGAMQFIRSEGVATFESRADALAARHGARFAMSDAVREVIRHLG